MKLKGGKCEERAGDYANLTLQVKGRAVFHVVWLDPGEVCEPILEVSVLELLYSLCLVPEEERLSGSQILLLWLKEENMVIPKA